MHCNLRTIRELIQNDIRRDWGLSRLPQVRTMTAPWVEIRVTNQARSYRVQMQISDQLEQVAFSFAKYGPVPPLKEVTDVPVSTIEIQCVTLLETLHEPGKWGGACLQEQVNMIRHEHVGVQGDGIAISVLLQSRKVGPMVPCILENLLSIVPSRYHVVEAACELDTWLACHQRFPQIGRAETLIQ
jgi:hypothetical protein